MIAALALLAFAIPDPTPDYPPASDVWRFPPAEAAKANRAANVRFEKYLNEERELWPPYWQPLFAETLVETHALGRAWDELYWAWTYQQCGDSPCYESWVRQSLHRLRLAVGEDAYRSATLPPAVPVWRFREMK